jgi:hypothetical protein
MRVEMEGVERMREETKSLERTRVEMDSVEKRMKMDPPVFYLAITVSM